MSRSSLPYRIAFVTCLTIASASSLEAKEVLLPDIAVSFNLPDSWKYEQSQEPGRLGVLLKPLRDQSQEVALRCRIDRHELPASFKQYTQDQLNQAYTEKPLTNEGFAAQIGQIAGVPATIIETGKSQLGKSLTYWAIYTTSDARGPLRLHFMSKIHLSQTPGYAWNVQCGAGSMRSASQAAEAYKAASSTFEALLSSVSITLY